MYKVSLKHLPVYSQLDSFIEMLSSEQGLSVNTINAYISDLCDFFLHLKQRVIAAEHVDQQIIESYLESLIANNISHRTKSRRLSAIKKYYAFLTTEKIIQHNPTLLIEKTKKPTYLPKLLSEDDTNKLILAAYTISTHDQQRRILFIELLYATGIRISELLSLKIADIDWQEECILVTGKGKKQRIVPFNTSTKEALIRYLNTLPHTTTWLFPSKNKLKPLSRQRFFQIIRELARDAGLDPNQISPHVMRHAFATHLLNRGANLMSIQKLLGHSNISTTEIYTHVMTGKLKDAVFQHHPLSSPKKRGP